MNFGPFHAQSRQYNCHRLCDAPQCESIEAIALAQLHRPSRAVKDKYCLAFRTYDEDMHGPMIVGIDGHSQAINAVNSRHDDYIETQALRKPPVRGGQSSGVVDNGGLGEFFVQ
jgi:hypothetical protein